jgi:hypothetical protein
MAAAVAAILSRWQIRESNEIHVAVGSHRKMRRVCHPHASPKASGAAKKGAALRHPAAPTDTTHYRAPQRRHPENLGRRALRTPGLVQERKTSINRAVI